MNGFRAVLRHTRFAFRLGHEVPELGPSRVTEFRRSLDRRGIVLREYAEFERRFWEAQQKA